MTPCPSSWVSSLLALSPEDREAALRRLSPPELEALLYDWPSWARPEQVAPEGDWTRWLILAGRGWGKTRTGAEWVRDLAERKGAKRIALVGRTAADVRDVMIGGESGILAISRPSCMPRWEPSKRQLTWPNGVVAKTYTSEKPDQLRGPQHDAAWCDEIAAWRYPDAWEQLVMGLRLGRPRAVITTTPRPTALVKKLLAHRRTHTTRGHTLDNRANLAADFLDEVVAAKGTRLGRQEYGAEVLDEVEGALWNLRQLEARVHRPEFRKLATLDADGAEQWEPVLPTFLRIVVGVDPATKATPLKAEPGLTGIVAVGLADDGLAYVLEDASGVYTPKEWASKVLEVFTRWSADRVVVEDNQGGDLVESNLRAADSKLPLKRVTAWLGKKARAEPVSALYEPQGGYPLGRVRHLGHHAELETQMTTWVPVGGAPSPDRLDALVWALSELLGNKEPKPKGKAWGQVSQHHADGG